MRTMSSSTKDSHSPMKFAVGDHRKPRQRRQLAANRSRVMRPPRVARKPVCGHALHSYFENSTLHGYRYIGERTITWLERSYFAVAVALVTVCAVYFAANVYAKWLASPVIVTLDPRSTAVTEIPFPAITICNMNQARRDVVQTFERNSNDWLLLRSVCNRFGNVMDENGSRANDTSWATFRRVLERVATPCADLLLSCRFGGQQLGCGHVFRTVLTDEGLCCTFNAADKRFMLLSPTADADFDPDEDDHYDGQQEWSAELGYSPKVPRHQSYPRRVNGPGASLGLSVIANVDAANYFCSSTNSRGLKLLLHSPIETPKISNYGYVALAGREHFIAVQPHTRRASDLLRPMPLGRRQCIFNGESQLRYYRTYTQNNCKMECEAQLVVERCGCRLYYLPRLEAMEVNICNSEDLQCSQAMLMEIAMGLNGSARCDCMPACFEISYTGHMSQVKMRAGFGVQQPMLSSANPEYMEHNLAVLNIYYDKKYFIGTTSEPFVGFTEFLSNIGGLLGLFMGFSVVSVIELLYYVTIRPFFVYARGKKTTRDGGDGKEQQDKERQQKFKTDRWHSTQVFPYTE